MGKYLIGALAGVVLAGVVGLAVALGGMVSVAAGWRDPAPLAWWLHTSYERSVARRAADLAVPTTVDDPAAALAGARAFEQMCAICHTPPGRSPTVQSAGLNPAPPELSRLLARRTPAQAFWVIRSGVRMTAMPAFGPTHRDEELWQLVAFLRQAGDLDGAGYARWLDRARVLPAGDGHNHHHGISAPDTLPAYGGKTPEKPNHHEDAHHEH